MVGHVCFCLSLVACFVTFFSDEVVRDFKSNGLRVFSFLKNIQTNVAIRENKKKKSRLRGKIFTIFFLWVCNEYMFVTYFVVRVWFRTVDPVIWLRFARRPLYFTAAV